MSLGKRKIPCGGKIALPWEIIDLTGITRGDRFGAVSRAGIHNDDLVHQIPDGVQTSRKHGLLIFYDHAKTDGSHKEPPFKENILNLAQL